MSYRVVALTLVLCASEAWAAKVAVVVEGGGERAGEIEKGLRGRVVGADDALVEAGAHVDDVAAWRDKLGVDRLVVATVQRQGKDRYLVTVRAVDASGVTRRFGEARGETLVEVAVRTAGELPPLPAPAPPANTATPATPGTPAMGAAATTPATGAASQTPAATTETPAAADAEPTPTKPPASESPPSRRRKHEYGLLIGGVVAFVVPWLATVGFAAHYLDYNANASRVGFAPIAGPFLARRKISDKDLSDGYDVGLTVDGAIQIVGTSVLIAGILYAAIGVPAGKHDRAARWRPLFAGGPGGAQLGAQVTW